MYTKASTGARLEEGVTGNLDRAHGKGTVAGKFVFAAANPWSSDEA
jgi:hypothetical protein